MGDTLLAIDIGSTNIVCVVAQNDLTGNINILGMGIESSDGINKGLITDIEVASASINNVIQNAKRSTQNSIDTTLVSISGAYTKGIRSNGSVNIPNGLITENEINQVLQMALYNATIVPDYDVIHVLPMFFKVDDSQSIDNPSGMNGARLEVSVYIVKAKKTVLTNIKSAMKATGLEVTNFVLNGYSSAVSVLDEEQKRFGTGVIDIGGSTTDFVCFKGKSILYNDFIPVGSSNITNDLSVMLHTPPNAAEMLKIKYGNLLKSYRDDELAIKKVKTPIIGDEQNTKEIDLDTAQTIIHARVEEILVLIKEKINNSGISESMGAGLVITGGMSQLVGIKELASKVFDDIPITVANPINIKNGYVNFEDPTMATIVGLLLYGLDSNANFELDSNKKLRKKTEKVAVQPRVIPRTEKKVERSTVVKEDTPLSIIPDRPKKGASKIWTKIAELF